MQVRRVYESGKWAEYIAVMSKFPNYSINNCILIASQCPGASFVCGYKKWNEFKETKEVQAESTAFWVAGMLGLDTSDYSFGYIAGWSKDKEVSELKDNLELIKKTADKITSDIDSYMKEVFKHEQKSTDIDSDVEVYFTVAECSEFHSMAGYTEKIESAEEAKGIFESMVYSK